MTKTATDLIGSAEACTILHVDRSTLSRWVAAGRLAPVHRLPGATGALLFSRAEVEALAVSK